MDRSYDKLREKLTSNLLVEDPGLPPDYYQSVLNSVGSVVYTVDRELRITSVNQQWDDLAQSSGNEHMMGKHVLGRYLLDHMQGYPLERWRSVCQQILDGQIPYYLDEVTSERTHDWQYFSLTARPLCDSQGDVVGITFVATNITQLKRAENEMFQRLVEIRGLSQVARTAGAWIDRRKVYKQVTADIANLFGAEKCVIFLWDDRTGNLQAREPAYGLAGRKLSNLSLDMGHPADPDSLWIDLEEKDHILLNEGDTAPDEMVETSARVDKLAAMMAFLRVSGRVHGAILVAGRDRPFTNQDGRLLALFAVPMALSIENTELNRLLLDRTQRLTEIQTELDRMIKLKQAVRMPLTVVQGYLELLLDGMLGPVPGTLRPTMHMVFEKAQAITSLVNRITPSRFPHDATRYEPIHIAGLLRMIVDKWVESVEQAGLELVTDLPEPYDQESMTIGDPDMLVQVFEGLLDNAIKFSHHGGTIKVSLQSSNEIVYAKIIDPGVGIAPDRQIHVWRDKKDAARTGPIPLSEVKRIIEGHGGQVWVESAPGQGSTFYVALRKPEHCPAL
jgi:PAS domain S-box-containing protein